MSDAPQADQPKDQQPPEPQAEAKAESPTDSAPETPAAPTIQAQELHADIQAQTVQAQNIRAEVTVQAPVTDTEAEDETPPESFKTRWLRRAKKAFYLLLLLLLLLRLALPYLLPTLASKGAAFVGLSCEYEELDLSISGVFIEIKGLRVGRLDNNEQVLQCERLHFDLATLDLIKGKVTVKRAEIIGFDVFLKRLSDGQLALLQYIQAQLQSDGTKPASEKAPEETKEPASKGPPWRIVTNPPIDFFIEVFRLERLRLRFQDNSVEPRFETQLRLDISVDNFGLPTAYEPGHIEVKLQLAPIIEELRLIADITIHNENLFANWSFDIQSLNIRSLEPYLKNTGLEQTGEPLNVHAEGRIGSSLAFGYKDAMGFTISAEKCRVFDNRQDYVSLKRLDIKIDALGLKDAVVRDIEVEGFRSSAKKLKDGALAFAGFELRAPKELPKETPKDSATALKDQQTEATKDSDPNAPLLPDLLQLVDIHAFLGLLEVRDVELGFRDESVEPVADLQLKMPLMAVSHVLFDRSKPQAKASFQVQLETPGLVSSIHLRGGFQPFAARKTLSLTADLQGINPKALAPYLKGTGVSSNFQSGRLHAELAAGLEFLPKKNIYARCDIKNVSLSDDKELAGVDRVLLENIVFDTTKLALVVGECRVEGTRGLALVNKDEKLVVGGVSLALKPAQAPKAEPEKDAEPDSLELPEPTNKTTKAESAVKPRVELKSLVLKKWNFQFRDLRKQEPLELALKDFGVSLSEIVLDLDPKSPTQKAPLQLVLRVPDVLQKFTIQGSLTPSLNKPALDLKLHGEGLQFKKIERLLKELGIVSEWQRGSFDMRVIASADISAESLGASLAIPTLNVSDGDKSLFKMTGLALKNAQATLEKGELTRVGLESLALKSLRTQARLEKDALRAMGFKVLLNKAKPAKAQPETKDKAPEPADKQPEPGKDSKAKKKIKKAKIPELQIQSLDLGDIVFVFEEATKEPVVQIPVKVGGKLGPFNFQEDTASPQTPFDFTVKLPQVIENIHIKGQLSLQSEKIGTGFDLTMTGMHFKALEPRLKDLGIETLLKAGVLSLNLESTITLKDQGLELGSTIKNLSMKEGQKEYWGVDGVILDSLTIKPNDFALKALEVVKPRIQAMRRKDGALLASGFAVNVPKPPSKDGNDDKEAKDSEAAEEAPAKAPKPAEPEPLVLPAVLVKRFEIKNAQAQWQDLKARKPVTLKPTVNVRLDDVSFQEQAKAGRLTVSAAIPQLLGQLTLTGPLSVAHKSVGAQLNLSMTGLTGKAIDGYLPPNLKVLLRAGRVSAQVKAEAKILGQRSFSALLKSSKISYTDGNVQYLKIKDLELNAPRIDLDKQELIVEAIALTGLESRAVQNKAGALRAMGIELRPAPKTAARAKRSTPAPKATEPPKAPRKRKLSDILKGQRRGRLPFIQVKRFEIGLSSVRFWAWQKSKYIPFQVKDLTIVNSGALRCFGPDAEDQPPMRWQIEGQVAPVLDSMNVQINLTPGALNPELVVNVDLEGLRGTELKAFLPPPIKAKPGKKAPEPFLQDIELTDGRFHCDIYGTLKLGRRDPSKFDFSKGFGADLSVQQVRFRDGQGPVLLGVDEVRVAINRIQGQSIAIRSVDISTPRAFILRDQKGIHVAGLRIKDLLAKAKKDKTDKEPAETEKKPAAKAKSQEPVKLPFDLKIGRIGVSGLDFVVKDTKAKPNMLLPMKRLEVEISEVSTAMLSENRSVRFEVQTGSDLAPLLKRPKKSTLPGIDMLTGLVDQATNLTGLTEEKVEFEPRRCLENVTVVGNVAIYPKLVFFSSLNVNAFDLATVMGVATEHGADIKSGLVDVKVVASLKGDDVFAMDSLTRMELLDVSESENGPIASTLQLEVPLGPAIFALRDEEEVIRIPLEVELNRGEISKARIVSILITQVSVQVAEAVKNTPFRVFGQVTDIGKGLVNVIPGTEFLPFGGSKQEAESITVDFLGASLELSETGKAEFEALVQRLKKDKRLVLLMSHEFGTGDVKFLESRVTPKPTDILGLINRYRTQKRGLMDRRIDLETRVHAAYDLGLLSDARRHSLELQRVERDVGLIELKLGELSALISKGAERRLQSRRREALVELGELRLERLRRFLGQRNIDKLGTRMRKSRVRFDEAKHTGGGRVQVRLTRRRE